MHELMYPIPMQRVCEDLRPDFVIHISPKEKTRKCAIITNSGRVEKKNLCVYWQSCQHSQKKDLVAALMEGLCKEKHDPEHQHAEV